MNNFQEIGKNKKAKEKVDKARKRGLTFWTAFGILTKLSARYALRQRVEEKTLDSSHKVW